MLNTYSAACLFVYFQSPSDLVRFFANHIANAGNGITGGMITIFHQMTFTLKAKLKNYELHMNFNIIH
jgi:hypothetical protein